jgi:hypothetical protein
VVMLIVSVVQAFRMSASTVEATPVPVLSPTVVHALASANAGWIAFALLLAFVSTFVSFRFAAGRG